MLSILNTIHSKTSIKPKRTINYNKSVVLNYYDYINKDVALTKYKLPELKLIAKQHKLLITGNKSTIIERVETHFNRITNVIKIQKTFRGNMVRMYFKLKKDNINNTKLCVNETDGYTLEPLNEICPEKLFTYSDNKQFIYGFDILSLLTVYNKKGKIINPYNRERLDSNITNKIIIIGKLINILFPYVLDDNEKEIISSITSSQRSTPIHHTNRVVTNNVSVTPPIYSVNSEYHQLYLRIQEIREQPLQRRIENLFMEIDSLGNYTTSTWFTNLEFSDYISFYRSLYEIWSFRGQMTSETKRNICILGDPFAGNSYSNSYLLRLSINELQKICVAIMENMIFCGTNMSFRQIGALHVLTALTIVSIPARINLIWLYESIL